MQAEIEPNEYPYEDGDDTTEGLGDGGPVIVIINEALRT